MKRSLILILVLMFVFAAVGSAQAENYVKPEVFKKWVESGKKMIIVDIQPKEDFEKQHFKGSLETQAYPAKTEEERKKLDAVLPKIRESREDVVIICPRGGGGAKNTYAYLEESGVPEDRIFILEKGMAGWPYKEMCARGR